MNDANMVSVLEDARKTGRLLTDAEAAYLLGLDHDGHKAPTEAIRYLCRSGKLKHRKVSGRLRFKRNWIEEFIDAETVEPIRLGR